MNGQVDSLEPSTPDRSGRLPPYADCSIAFCTKGRQPTMATDNTPSPETFVTNLDEMTQEDVRVNFYDLFAQALAIEEAEAQAVQGSSHVSDESSTPSR